jgi:hypothetical protein
MLASICDSFSYQSHSGVGQAYVFWISGNHIDPG